MPGTKNIEVQTAARVARSRRLLIAVLCLALIYGACTSLIAAYYFLKGRTAGGDTIAALGIEGDVIKLNEPAEKSAIEAQLLRRHGLVVPLAERPFLILSEPRISWSKLTPKADDLVLELVPGKVVGTFPSPRRPEGSNLDTVKWDDQEIRFSAPGEHYLRTSAGNFKILVLENKEPGEDQILEIVRFVSGNIVHSLATYSRFSGMGVSFKPKDLFREFFASDQPLKLWCGEASDFLACILGAKGYVTRKVQLLNAAGSGHQVIEVKLPERERYILLDADFGMTLLGPEGQRLSIGEVAQLAHKAPRRIEADNTVGKYFLKGNYNTIDGVGGYMPDFYWTPDKLRDHPVKTEDYLEMIRKYALRYGYGEYSLSFSSVKWGPMRAWNGTPE